MPSQREVPSSFTPWSRLDGAAPADAALPPGSTVGVIGAGSSGLVSAKHLVDAGYDVTVFERSADVGGAFVSKAYEGAHLVSSTYLTAFSDLRLETDRPSAQPHLPLADYVSYLRKYATTFGLRARIRFDTEVVSVTPASGGGYDVETRATGRAAASHRFDALCVCCGVHDVPHTPDVRGLRGFRAAGGKVVHSAEYTSAEPFAGSRVLVVGCGESGMDLTHQLVRAGVDVRLSLSSGGLLAVPHEGFGGLPLDTLIANFGEHAFEHRWCHALHLKWGITTLIIRLGFLLVTGTSIGYAQWVGRARAVRRGHNILCKSTAALPHINAPARRAAAARRFAPWTWLWARIDPPDARGVPTHGPPVRVSGRRVDFTDGSSAEVDVIVFATGYGVRFPFLSPTLACGGAAARAAGSQRAERGAEHALPSEHLVVEPHAPRLARIGFVRPNVGAIPPMAEMQVLWWIERLRGRTRHQRAPPSYGLLGRKLAYGVDYGNYMHQLAAEIGAAPTLADLCRSPRALIAYALGQAYIPFFRLVGPFASDAAWRVAASELYAPVLQRGVIMNAVFVLTIVAFGVLSLIALAVECTLRAILPRDAMAAVERAIERAGAAEEPVKEPAALRRSAPPRAARSPARPGGALNRA